MASRGRPRPGSLQVLAAVLLLAAASGAAAGSPDRPAPGPPLFLPLTRSYPNASQLAGSLRRGLGGGAHPNARMRLHDDLLTNGSVQLGFFNALGFAQFFGCYAGSEARSSVRAVGLVQVLHDEAVHRDAPAGVRADR